MTEKIAQKMEKLFVNRDDVYVKAYLSKDKKRMAYTKEEGIIDNILIEEHIKGNITLGVYQLKGTKVKWGCLDFDLNTKEDFNNAKKLYKNLKELGYNPLAEKSGGGDYKVHIWIFANCEARDMFYFLENICKENKVMAHEIFPKQEDAAEGYGNLVKLPLAYHLVTKRGSVFLDDKFKEIVLIEDIDKILQEHLNNIDTLPKIIIKEKKITEYKSQSNQSPNEFDNFMNAVLSTELPEGKSAKEKKYQKITGVNDNILKNQAIWFYKKGFDLERLEAEVKPIYKANGWAFGDLKGWFKKAEKGDITEINAGELYEYCDTYAPELLKFIPNLQEQEEQSEEFIDFDVYSYEDLKNYKPPEQQWLIENQIPKNEIGLLVGKRQERKTFFALYQTLCLASGLDCVEDKTPDPKKVLILDEESGEGEIAKRIKLLAKPMELLKKNLEIKFVSYAGLKLDNPESKKYKKFKELVEEFKPDLIIVDCLQRVVSFEVDKDNQAISEFFTGIVRPFTKTYECSWLFIHHLRKGLSGNQKAIDPLDEVRGGSELVNYCRYVLSCRKPRHQNDPERELIVFEVLKMANYIKSSPKVIAFSSDNEGIKVTYEGVPEDILTGEQQCANAIKDWLFNEGIKGEFTTKQINESSEQIGFKRSLIAGGLRALLEQRFLERPTGKNRGFYKISDKQSQEKLV